MNLNDINKRIDFTTHVVITCLVCGLLVSTAFAQSAGETGDEQINMTDYGTVDLSVQDTDLAVVLQMLSIEAKKNIITSKSVSATVTANLYDVTFYEALKAILEVNGFTFYEEGNFIYVITKEEAEALEAARRRTESRIFELDYLSATDATEFILPLLSDDGKASARGDVQPGIKPAISDVGADNYAFTPRLVVNDYEENMEAIAELLGELDTPPQQVLVEATILQTSLDEANAFGMDFSVIGSLNFGDLTNPLSAIPNLLAGNETGPGTPATSSDGFEPADSAAAAGTVTVGNAGGPGGLKIGVLSDDVAVFLRVLDEVTDSTVLARPKVMALNRQRAQVLVGARIGYLSTTATQTSTTQTVEFLDTGIELVFRPFISKDGMIRMELSPSVSEASLRSVTDAQGLIVTIPDELTNELTTNVRIQDGQTLVLGGLFRESTSITRRQVPFLGDIPIVGAAFKGQDDTVGRSEIIFLITPSIVKDETLWAAGETSKAAVDSIRVGARIGLLPFSRDKMTSRYNQQAVDAFKRGDTDQALFFINNSLRTAPMQPEMIRLREKVTGEKAKVHERSLMERVYRKHMGPPMENAPVVQARPLYGTFLNQNQNQAQTGSGWTQTHPTNTQQANTLQSTTVTQAPGTESGEPEIDSTPEEEPTLLMDARERYYWRRQQREAVDEDAGALSPNNSNSSTGSTASDDFEDESNEDESLEDGSAEEELIEPQAKAKTNQAPKMTSKTKAAADDDSYQQFLHGFFVRLGMPEIADDQAVSSETPEEVEEEWDFPFVTFDDLTDASSSSEEQPE